MKRAPDTMIGNSTLLAEALDHISALAPVPRPVLVLGERGTGKELAAQRLHFLSPRWDAPLVKVNCAAMAEELLESELFGYEPGAFTGATRLHHGRFERADGGTLFLDELGTMSLRLQEKLLRVVEYGEFERLGGQQSIAVDVRVVAATNADLPQLAASGEFRADLLDRLSFDVVHLPPLRERREDVTELATHFGVGMSSELGWDLFPGFGEAAMATLLAHDWPGNVRELKNVVERSLYRWGDAEAPVDDIVIDPFHRPWASSPAAPSMRSDALPATEPDSETDTKGNDAGVSDFAAHMDALEKQVLVEALARHGQHQRRTADALGLTYDQLRGLVRKHRLSRRRRN